MTLEQLKFISDFKEKRKHVPTKQDSDAVDEIIDFLKSFSIISKNDTSDTLELVDRNSLNKLIELKSLSNFEKWYLNKDKDVTNNFNNYGVNNGIQSVDSDFDKPKINHSIKAPVNKPDKKSSLQKFFSNPWVLLIVTIAIEEITLGEIYKFICNLF